jgi:hypothetical protein
MPQLARKPVLSATGGATTYKYYSEDPTKVPKWYSIPASAPTNPSLVNVATEGVFPQPYQAATLPGYLNRLQSEPTPPYLDGWGYKTPELIKAMIGGGPAETVDQMISRGHNWVDYFLVVNNPDILAQAKPTWNLFLDFSAPYGGGGDYGQQPFRALTDSLLTIINAKKAGWYTFNTSRANGLFEGVKCMKEVSLNIEYYFFLENNAFQFLTENQKDTSFFNYTTGQNETIRQCYNRSGEPGLNAALIQKWNNLILAHCLYQNARNPGVRTYYGDGDGETDFYGIQFWFNNYSITSLLSANVNDANLFKAANTTANAGVLTIDGITIDVSGSLYGLTKYSHTYRYDFTAQMSNSDYRAWRAIGPGSPSNQKQIDNWYPKLKQEDPYVCYNEAMAFMVRRYVRQQKGWVGNKIYRQIEPAYESGILLPEQGYARVEIDVPWEQQGVGVGNQNKLSVPLNPQIGYRQVVNARFFYEGLYSWSYPGNWMDYAKVGGTDGPYVYPSTHDRGREGIQRGLNDVNIYNEKVFTADKIIHVGNIAVKNPADGVFYTLNPEEALKKNGGNLNNPVPLVCAVTSPSQKGELYLVFYPNAEMSGGQLVTWRSPINGHEMTTAVYGWQPTLYYYRPLSA